MTRLLFIFALIIGLVFWGCGEQPEADGNGNGAEDTGEITDSGDETGDSGEEPVDRGDDTVTSMAFDLETPDLAVGQWIEYGVDEMTEIITFSVVDTEMNQGTECYWIQISGPGFVGQVLVDPAGLDVAMEDYQDQFGEFVVDPAAYIRENMSDAQGMANMFGNEESIDMALTFIKAIRIIKFEQQGMIMAIDLVGVPEFLEGMMDDPAFQEQFQQGFMQGFDDEGGQEGLNEIIAELDNMEFDFTETTEILPSGDEIDGIEFSIRHPEGEIVAVISNELPLIPLAYASVTGFEDNESHSIQVRGFGFSGAENLLPGEAAQTIPAMMFLQGMEQQMSGGMN
jgi:hypothetical protein